MTQCTYLRNRFPPSVRVRVLLEWSSPLIYTVWCLSVTSSSTAPISSFVVIWCEFLCIIEMLLAQRYQIYITHCLVPERLVQAPNGPWAAGDTRRKRSRTLSAGARPEEIYLSLYVLFVAQCDTAFVCVEIWCCKQQQIWCVYLGIRWRINATQHLWCYLNELICISSLCLSHSI